MSNGRAHELCKSLSEGLPLKHEITVERLLLPGCGGGYVAIKLKHIYVAAHLDQGQAEEAVAELRRHLDPSLPLRWVNGEPSAEHSSILKGAH